MQFTQIMCLVVGFVMVFAIVEEIQYISEEIKELSKSEEKQPEDLQSGVEQGGDVPEVDNSTSLEVEPAVTETNRTQNETVHVKPKRIACIRRELPKEVPMPDSDVEYEDTVEGEKSSADLFTPHPNEDFNAPGVKVVNSSLLLQLLLQAHNQNVTNRTTPAECHIVMFYAKWCPFSAQAAPHFNAFGRIFHDFGVYAVDSSRHQGLNTQFGITALPMIFLFHNSKPASKFNHTVFNLENFSQFINTVTGIDPPSTLELLDDDHIGPLSSTVVEEPDYILYSAWIFTILCGLFYFSKSSYFNRLVESVHNNWREVEIQHEHNE